MSQIELIQGEIFSDERGTISSLNRFKFDEIRRCYFVTNSSVDILRGWNGHRFERKWFYTIKGSFAIFAVKIEDMQNPKPLASPEVYYISDKRSEILAIPVGYATLIKATKPDSILMVGSDKLLEESKQDSYKFDSSLWVNWSNMETT